MTDEPISDLDRAVAAATRTTEAVVLLVAAMSDQRKATKRANIVSVVAVAVVAVVLAASLFFVISGQNTIRDNQESGAERGKRIEFGMIQINCAFAQQTATPDTSLEGRKATIARFNRCVRQGGPTTTTQPKETP